MHEELIGKIYMIYDIIRQLLEAYLQNRKRTRHPNTQFAVKATNLLEAQLGFQEAKAGPALLPLLDDWDQLG